MHATTAYIDPDVPAGVVELIGSAYRDDVPQQTRSRAGRKSAAAKAAEEAAKAEGTQIPAPSRKSRPNLPRRSRWCVRRSATHRGRRTLVAAAKAGEDVVRVVAGDPLTTDSVLAEVNAVARTSIQFEVLPDCPPPPSCPVTRACRSGPPHSRRRARRGRLAGAGSRPGPLVLHATSGHLAEAASALTEHGMAAQTPVAITINGTTCAQRTIEGTLATINELGGALAGPLVLTVGKGREPAFQAVVVGVAVAVRLDRAGAAYQGSGRRHERPVSSRTAPSQGGADDRRRTAAQPRPDGTRRQGPRRRPLPVGRVHLHQRGACRVGRSSPSSVSTPAPSPASRSPAWARPPPIRSVPSASTPNSCPRGSRARSGCSTFPPYDDVFDPVNRVRCCAPT